jgi:hypothetical protein
MPNTMTDLVAALRTALGDTTIPYLWDDPTLEQCVADAVNEHSFEYPRLTYGRYALTAGQQEVALAPVGGAGLPDPAAPSDLVAVVGVELPPGTPIPADAWGSAAPAGAAASRAAQGYRARPGVVRLRVPASGAEVGPATLVVAATQTWDLPDTGGTAWNGPAADLSLLLLLARRAAYQTLAEWQARAQGLTTPTIAGTSSNVHIDVPPILAALEVQIRRALDLRAPHRPPVR